MTLAVEIIRKQPENFILYYSSSLEINLEKPLINHYQRLVKERSKFNSITIFQSTLTPASIFQNTLFSKKNLNYYYVSINCSSRVNLHANRSNNILEYPRYFSLNYTAKTVVPQLFLSNLSNNIDKSLTFEHYLTHFGFINQTKPVFNWSNYNQFQHQNFNNFNKVDLSNQQFKEFSSNYDCKHLFKLFLIIQISLALSSSIAFIFYQMFYSTSISSKVMARLQTMQLCQKFKENVLNVTYYKPHTLSVSPTNCQPKVIFKNKPFFSKKVKRGKKVEKVKDVKVKEVKVDKVKVKKVKKAPPKKSIIKKVIIQKILLPIQKEEKETLFQDTSITVSKEMLNQDLASIRTNLFDSPGTSRSHDALGKTNSNLNNAEDYKLHYNLAYDLQSSSKKQQQQSTSISETNFNFRNQPEPTFINQPEPTFTSGTNFRNQPKPTSTSETNSRNQQQSTYTNETQLKNKANKKDTNSASQNTIIQIQDSASEIHYKRQQITKQTLIRYGPPKGGYKPPNHKFLN